ncbi:MAG: hypothetical protein JSS89_03430 [Bacteroidetes bacterium]|nr:hypothetical protein [Bacteroidota bacterium]
MKHVAASIALAIALATPALAQDLQTRDLRLVRGGVSTLLRGSASGGTLTLPQGGGTLLTRDSLPTVAILYAPTAPQETNNVSFSYLFDIAYDPTFDGSACGARIESISTDNLNPQYADGLTVVVEAAPAGGDATGLSVRSTATAASTNTLGEFIGSNGLFVIDGRNISTDDALPTLTLKGAQNSVTSFATLDFSNYDAGSGTDQRLVSIQAIRSAANSADLRFFTGQSGTLNSTPTLTLERTGKAGIATDIPNVTLDVNGDVAMRSDGTNLALAAGSQTLDATGRSFIVVTANAGGTSAISTITGGFDGKVLVIYNRADNLTFVEDAGADGILTLSGADITTTGAGSATLVYSSNAGRWIVTGFRP